MFDSAPLLTFSHSFLSWASFILVHLIFLDLYQYPWRLVSTCFFLGTHCGGRRCALPPAPPHPLLFCNRRPLLPTPIPFAFSISINDLGSYVLLSSYFFLGTHCGGRGCALPPAPPHPLLFCNRRHMLPTPIPFAFSISINDLGSYALLSWYACPPPCTPPPAFIL